MNYSVRKQIHVTIAICLLTTVATAQPYYFRHYEVENGLSNNTVFCITQDSNGFIWAGTKDGLSRFDGYHFKVFRLNGGLTKNDLNANYIFSIWPRKDGTIWVGAKKGLYRFNAKKERLEPFIDTLQNIYSMQVDREGQLWFVTRETLCRYNFKTRVLKEFPAASYFHATSVCMAHDGSIWASTNDGFLERFNDTTQAFTAYDVFAHSPRPASRWVQRIRADGKHSIYIGTSSQGIKRFDMSSSKYEDLIAFTSDKTSLFVRDILQYHDNEFWFATESGIFILNTDTDRFTNLKKKFSDPYSLNDNALYSLFKDSEGNIWAGTYFGGINYYAKENVVFRKYFPDNSGNAISGNAVREICSDGQGNLWIGTEDNGLNKFDKKTGSFTHFEPTGEKSSIAYINIHGLLANGNDLWIGTFEHGTQIMDTRTGKIIKHFMAGPGKNELKSNFTLCFLRTHSGRILAGTSNGAYAYNPELDGFDRIPAITPRTYVCSMLEDHSHTIWIGTGDHGVFWWNPDSKSHGHIERENPAINSPENKTINDLYEDENNNLWMATEGAGLCKLSPDRKKYTWYTTKDGLPGNFIFKILGDDQKHLWLSTSRGLVDFDPATRNMVVYTQANGLLNDQFNYHSGYKDPSGRLYFGSVRGMISFNPADLVDRPFAPPIYITGLQVFDRELTVDKDSTELKQSIIYTNKIILPHYQSTISIDFAALSYISPKMTEYSYRLAGLNDQWTKINTNRKVYFTNLSPGKYVFQLKAAANDVWSRNMKELTIEILPPFWVTGWAILLYVILGILIAYYVFRSYHRRQQNKKEKEIYKSKIEFFTNVAHEIRTPLTLIKGPVENILEKDYDIDDIREDIDCLDRNTNRLMDLASQILDFRQTEVKGFSLDFTKVNITELLRETYLSFKIFAQKRKLAYHLQLPPVDIAGRADADALQKIFSNLIGNAVKYAKEEVTIRLSPPGKNETTFTVEFENDGYIIPTELEEKIFEPFYRIKETNHQKGTGIGLTLARSLAQLHQGNIYLEVAKKEINLFRLVLPLQPGQADKSGKKINSTTK